MKTQAGGANYPNPETLRQYSNAVVNSAALKWVLRNENVATTIPGIGNYDHMRANMAIAGNLEYTDEEKKFLSDNSIKLSMGFCRQCRKCLASCPHNTEIPDLMRTHMYATQYADLHKARMTIDQIARGRGLDACALCSTCTAQCVNSVDIPRKIGDLKLIYA
jgi:predicted aldo/keto reductase-like oxidoreductase